MTYPDWVDGTEPCRRFPDEFFPPPGNAYAAFAKSVCASCPKRRTCRDWALDTRQPAGIWGGLTPYERTIVLRRRGTA